MYDEQLAMNKMRDTVAEAPVMEPHQNLLEAIMETQVVNMQLMALLSRITGEDRMKEHPVKTPAVESLRAVIINGAAELRVNRATAIDLIGQIEMALFGE